MINQQNIPYEAYEGVTVFLLPLNKSGYDKNEILFKEPFATIYIGQDKKTNQKVLIKEYNGKLQIDPNQNQALMKLKIESNAKDCFLPIHDYYFEDDTLHAVFEFQELGSLRDYFEKDGPSSRQLEEQDIWNFGRSLALILEELSQQNRFCVLNPNELYFGLPSGLARLFLDYEIRKIVGLPIFYSSWYTDPDILKAEDQNRAYRACGQKSSMWSIGVILSEMCCSDLSLVSQNLANISAVIPNIYSKKLNVCLSSLLKPQNGRMTLKEFIKEAESPNGGQKDTKRQENINSVPNKDHSNGFLDNIEKSKSNPVQEEAKVVPENKKEETLKQKKKSQANKSVLKDLWQKKVQVKDLEKLFESNPGVKEFVKELYQEIYNANTPKNLKDSALSSQEQKKLEDPSDSNEVEIVAEKKLEDPNESDKEKMYLLNAERKKSETFYREEIFRVEDAMNRIIVGDERCCASSFYNGCYYVASNQDNYQKEKLQITLVLRLNHKVLNNKYEIHPELLVHVSEDGFTNHNTLIIQGKVILCEEIGREEVFALNNLNQTFSLKDLKDYINDAEIRDANSSLYNQSISVQVKEINQRPIVDNQYHDLDVGVLIFNDWRRRYEQFIKYIIDVVHFSSLIDSYVTTDLEISQAKRKQLAEKVNKSLCQFLYDSMLWKASSWCSIKSEKSALIAFMSEKGSQFYEEFEKFFAEFYKAWKNWKPDGLADLMSKKKNYSIWINRCLNQENFSIPKSFLQNYKTNGPERFLIYCTRYLIDIEEVQSYILRAWLLDNSSFTKWIMKYDSTKNIDDVLKYVEVDEEIHAEMKLLTRFLENGDLHKLDYISTALLCCPHCYFTLTRFEFDKFQTGDILKRIYGSHKLNGYHGNVSSFWKIPSMIVNNKDYLKIFLGGKLFEQYKELETLDLKNLPGFRPMKQGEFALKMIENIGQYADHELRSLMDVSQLKNTDKQLPDIPFEKEQEKGGMDIKSNFMVQPQYPSQTQIRKVEHIYI